MSSPPRVLRARLALACLVLMGGCSDDPEFDLTFESEVMLSEAVSTVATMRWAALPRQATSAYVEYGPTDEYGAVAPAALNEDDRFEAVVVGMKPATTYHLRAVIEQGTDVTFGDDQTVTTGAVHSALAELTLDPDLHDPLLADKGFLVTATVPGRATIIDADGDRVWWHAVDLDHQNCTTRAYLSPDGTGVIYFTWVTFALGGAHSEIRHLIRTSFDGTDVEMIPVPTAHHDFVELPDGTLTTLRYDELPPGGIYGDSLVERHPDGNETEIWRLWDVWEFSMEDVHENGSRWGHSNALDYDPVDDAYYVSTLYLDTIFKIDRATGDVIWRLGGSDSDFDLITGDDGWFDGQHQFQLTDDGIVVFDNGPYAETGTRIVEYRLDEDAMTAELVWSHEPDPPLGIYAYGDVHRLDSGNTLVAWSAAGRVDQITPNGETVWRLNAAIGAGFGYAQWVDSMYSSP